MARVPALDVVRFIAAFVVVLHHLIAVPHGVGPWPIPQLLGSAWFGRAAVVVFFIVSGYCVHAPYTRRTLDVGEFYIRRYVRILIPIAVIVPIALLLRVNYHPYHGWVTWTLVCECVYYGCYPLLAAVWARCGMVPTLVIAYGVGYAALVASALIMPEGWPWHSLRDILAYLPAWLLGCAAAEWAAVRGQEPRRSMLSLRAIPIAAGFGLGFLHYTGIIDLNWTFPLYALLVMPWFMAELATVDVNPILRDAGSWSYSLYLVHPVAAFGIAYRVIPRLPLPGVMMKPLAILTALVVGYVFYKLVEKPSHELARRLAQRARSARFEQDAEAMRHS